MIWLYVSVKVQFYKLIICLIYGGIIMISNFFYRIIHKIFYLLTNIFVTHTICFKHFSNFIVTIFFFYA